MRSSIFYSILAGCFGAFLIFICVYVARYEDKEFKRCDPRLQTCQKGDHRERCDGPNLIIRDGYHRDSTATVSPNSPKCAVVSDKENT